MTPQIIDTSHNNADVQFHTLPVLVCFFKASQGKGFKDPVFGDHVSRARSTGKRIGAYHFIDDSDPQAQLANFEEAVRGHGPMIHALDFESNPAGGDATAATCAAMIDALVASYGRHPVVYGSNFLTRMAAYGAEARDCPLWEARYSTHQPTAPYPWTQWTIWQYSESGPILVGGVERTDIDLSVYNPAIFASDDAFTAWWDSRMVSVT